MTPVLWRACAADGHEWDLIVVDAKPAQRTLLWLPALGVAARHYLPFAHALAAQGVNVALHEWRGHGSSTRRAARGSDWGYRELLERDLPASLGVLHARLDVPQVLIGGHSLGGQLACCSAALAPSLIEAVLLVASGSPYWRAFPSPLRYGLPIAYRFLPWLARINGALPGRRIGFGGTEAPGVMHDWARTALSGHYDVLDWPVELERKLGRLDVPVTSITFAEDWFAPSTSRQFLLDKMPLAPSDLIVMDRAALGAIPDHFAWMRSPDAVAKTLAQSRARL